MIRTFLKATAVAAMTVATAGVAGAQSTGFINLVGQLQVSSSPGATTPLFIDILSGSQFPQTGIGNGVPGNVQAGTTTGFFSGLTGTSGVMQDLQVTGGSTLNTNPAGNLNSFLQIGAYTFAFGPVAPATNGVVNFGPISLDESAGGVNATIVVGNAMVMGGACGTVGCAANGLITAQFAQYAGAGGATRLFNDVNSGAVITPVTFSANFNASVVPEPSTYALLASGLGAIGMMARRRRQQA